MLVAILVDEVRDREFEHGRRRLSGREYRCKPVSDIDGIEQSGNFERPEIEGENAGAGGLVPDIGLCPLWLPVATGATVRSSRKAVDLG
ncbi:hypothetical protein NKI51_29185 [Mesorhizobium australicum]|uniref:Uncharacterized protein n=1 Tax=Mesorhizobium australicum TaxID=536018 RepID=A0ACC6T752_9HYPH